MSHVINGETVYTREEVDTEIFAIRHNQQEKTVGAIQTITLDVLRDKVINDVIDEAQALDVYNSIADKVGSVSWPTLDSIALSYTVYVNYMGDQVLEVANVQADSEEDAITEVRDNLSIDRARLSFDISYSGEAGDACDSHDVEFNEDDIFAELEFSAEEQD